MHSSCRDLSWPCKPSASYRWWGWVSWQALGASWTSHTDEMMIRLLMFWWCIFRTKIFMYGDVCWLPNKANTPHNPDAFARVIYIYTIMLASFCIGGLNSTIPLTNRKLPPSTLHLTQRQPASSSSSPSSSSPPPSPSSDHHHHHHHHADCDHLSKFIVMSRYGRAVISSYRQKELSHIQNPSFSVIITKDHHEDQETWISHPPVAQVHRKNLKLAKRRGILTKSDFAAMSKLEDAHWHLESGCVLSRGRVESLDDFLIERCKKIPNQICYHMLHTSHRK